MHGRVNVASCVICGFVPIYKCASASMCSNACAPA